MWNPIPYFSNLPYDSAAGRRKIGESRGFFQGRRGHWAVAGGEDNARRTLFPEKPYVSLENPDTLRFSVDDPRGFLDTYPQGAVLDEAQRAPHLFSYLQQRLDESRAKGQFILTGSNNFLLQQSIAQSLAGRIGYLTLLPFSVPELQAADLLPPSLEATIFTGAYPPIYGQEIAPTDWYPAYIRTYVERDVRQIKNITDLLTFGRFLRLCAGRTGQELNYASLAVETGVDVKTAQAWIGVLESSFVVHPLPAFHRNYNKTIVRRPKLYFTDTGLACSLLGITESAQLSTHPLRGPLFETLVVGELLKARLSRGAPSNLATGAIRQAARWM